MTTDTATAYGADDLTHLEGLDAVRKRPGMYIGSTDSRGVLHLLSEIVDNSIDEAVAGVADRVQVTLHADGSVEVTDNGRGIPVDINTKSGLPGVVLTLTKLHAGGKFSSKNYNSSGGLHGVGMKAVNALSRRMDVTVHRDGAAHSISFQHGTPGFFDGEGPEAPFAGSTTLRVVPGKATDPTGTTIRYWHDTRYFDTGAALDIDTVVTKMRNSAFLVPGLTVEFTDHTGPTTHAESFRFPGGLTEMVTYLAPDSAICDPIVITGSGTYRENAPDETGVMQSNVLRTMEVEVVLRWGTGYDSTVSCFTNTIPNAHGGTHSKGFDRAVHKALTTAIANTRGLLKPKEDTPTVDDALEGVTAVIHVRVPEPQFTSQTKDELRTPGVTKVIATIVEAHLKAWVEDRKTKTEARVVLGKIVEASRVRRTQKAQKDAARRKTALEGASMPTKLVDCRSTGVERSELFIVEGDSAGGSAKSARVAEYQAVLPIRGKILNTQRATMTEMLNNAECSSIIQVVGAGSGRTFDLDKMRYGRIIIMADADDDGSHIRCLLLCFFMRFMRPVIEAGRLYAAMPPLFAITTKGRSPETVMAYTTAEMTARLEAYQRAGTAVVTPIKRFKGLGEMQAEELWETTMDPAVRSVRRITIDDVEAAEAVLELLMGEDVNPRRDWLVESFDRLDADAIDA